MKRHGILNAPLIARLAQLGHTDLVVVADCGLPIPAGVPVVDLAVVPGLPGFLPVLDALLSELEVEGASIAGEAEDANPRMWQELQQRFPDAAVVSHEDLKRVCHHARFVVRTGEATPFANVILRCGVPF